MAIQWQRLFTAEEHATWVEFWITPSITPSKTYYTLHATTIRGQLNGLEIASADTIEDLQQWAGEYGLFRPK